MSCPRLQVRGNPLNRRRVQKIPRPACIDGENRFRSAPAQWRTLLDWFDPTHLQRAHRPRAGDRDLRRRSAPSRTAGATGGFSPEELQPERAKVDRAEKQELIGFLQEVFKASGVVVVAHYSGL